MPRFLSNLLIALAFSASPCSPAAQPAEENPSIMVMADPALAVPLARLAREYSLRQGGIVTLAYGSSAEQMQLIEEGAPADLFISTDPELIEKLKLSGLADVYSEAALASSRLALVGPSYGMSGITIKPGLKFSELLHSGDEPAMFILPDAKFLSQGIFSARALADMDMTADLQPYAVSIKDVPSMLKLIRNNSAYGILYDTDVAFFPAAQIIDYFPQSPPIAYHAVVVAGENMTPARAFLDFLKSEKAQTIFRASGFGIN